MESASVVILACVNAPSGIAFAPTELVVVFCVVPLVIPALALDPPDVVAPASTVAAGAITFDEGVYFTPDVSAFDPAEAEADAENDVDAAAPLAPDDALD